jgi:hypothetical protein
MLRRPALIAITALGVSASAGGVMAQALPMYGSDTLFDVTTKIINDCVSQGALPANSLTYKGTGSSQGGKAMGAGDPAANPVIPAQNQQVAPQSRFLNSGECNFFSANQGQGINIGLDSIAIVSDNTSPTNTCDNLKYTGSLSGFNFDDWRDVLRIVYAGQSAKVTPLPDPCSPADPTATPSAPGNIIGRCDSALRKALVSNWGNLFEGGCTNARCPSGLRHAFRRDDSSGTTDTFLTLLGLPKVTTRTFCNGFEIEDLDPIRTACDTNEQVCSTIPYANRNANPEGGTPSGAATNPAARGGDLGLVLAITMPTNTALQYGAPCSLGAFKYAPMPASLSTEAQRCPDGNARAFGLCRYPTTSAGKFNCRASATTQPTLRAFTNMDGRAYNLVPRDPDTGNLLITSNVPDQRWGGGGAYRLHQTAPISGGTGTCTQTDATRQIGCLVNADPCTIGYAGREALTYAGASTLVKPLKLRTPLVTTTSVAPTVADTLLLLDPSGSANGTCGNGAGDNFGMRYPLSRKLWINASKGFGSLSTFSSISNTTNNGVTSNENSFMKCVANRANNITDTAVSTFGFISIPAASSYPSQTCP